MGKPFLLPLALLRLLSLSLPAGGIFHGQEIAPQCITEDLEYYQSRRDGLLRACGEFCHLEGEIFDAGEASSSDLHGLTKSIDCRSLWETEYEGEVPRAWPPPNLPPCPMLNDFLWKGSSLSYWHLAEREMGDSSTPVVWTEGMIDAIIDWAMSDIKGGWVQESFGGYGEGYARLVLEGIKQMNVTGKKVLVVGSLHPWVEALLLYSGASAVVTLEYRPITSLHQSITTLTFAEARTQYLSGKLAEFDGVVSVSSLEHSGLGRYGDPLNPWGDLMAMGRIWCLVKQNGNGLISVPLEEEGSHLVWNAHRIYGREQFRHLIANWDVEWAAPVTGDAVDDWQRLMVTRKREAPRQPRILEVFVNGHALAIDYGYYSKSLEHSLYLRACQVTELHKNLGGGGCAFGDWECTAKLLYSLMRRGMQEASDLGLLPTSLAQTSRPHVEIIAPANRSTFGGNHAHVSFTATGVDTCAALGSNCSIWARFSRPPMDFEFPAAPYTSGSDVPTTLDVELDSKNLCCSLSCRLQISVRMDRGDGQREIILSQQDELRSLVLYHRRPIHQEKKSARSPFASVFFPTPAQCAAIVDVLESDSTQEELYIEQCMYEDESDRNLMQCAYNLGDRLNAPRLLELKDSGDESFARRSFQRQVGSSALRAAFIAAFPNSLIASYLNLSIIEDSGDDFKYEHHPNPPRFRAVVDSLAFRLDDEMGQSWGPREDEVVIHVRSGDKGSMVDENFIAAVQSAINLSQESTSAKTWKAKIGRVAVLAAAHWDGDDLIHSTIERDVHKVCASVRHADGSAIPCQHRSGNGPDRDVAYASRARVLVVHEGGFSFALALACRGTVFYTPRLKHLDAPLGHSMAVARLVRVPAVAQAENAQPYLLPPNSGVHEIDIPLPLPPPHPPHLTVSWSRRGEHSPLIRTHVPYLASLDVGFLGCGRGDAECLAAALRAALTAVEFGSGDVAPTMQRARDNLARSRRPLPALPPSVPSSAAELACWGRGLPPLAAFFDSTRLSRALVASRRFFSGNHARHASWLDSVGGSPKLGWKMWSEGWFDLLGPVLTSVGCDAPLPSFGDGDGEKRVCLMPPLQAPDCVALSIGSQGDYSYEAALVDATPYCTVHTFDCSGHWPVPPRLRGRVTFHQLCLAGSTDWNASLVSWSDLLGHIGLSRPPTHLKIDIEGYEYSVMTDMLESGHFLPDQISIEVHAASHESPPLMASRGGHRFDKGVAAHAKAVKSPGELALFGHFLLERGGYLIVDRRDHPVCESCSELVLARVLCPGV